MDRLGAEVLEEGMAGAETLEFAILVSEIFRSEVCGSRATKIIFSLQIALSIKPASAEPNKSPAAPTKNFPS